MMRGTSQGIAILLVVSAMLLAPSLAVAQVNDPITITYSGETGETGSGIGTYSGALHNEFSDSLWDYVYDLSDTRIYEDPTFDGGPWYWGIACDYEPEHMYDVGTTPRFWYPRWDDEIVYGEYGGAFNNSPTLLGRSVVFWTWNGPHNEHAPYTGTFHYQSTWRPALRPWEAEGDTDTYSGADQEWSASPEPASMALTGLALLGVGFWRRRKKTV